MLSSDESFRLSFLLALLVIAGKLKRSSLIGMPVLLVEPPETT